MEVDQDWKSDVIKEHDHVRKYAEEIKRKRGWKMKTYYNMKDRRERAYQRHCIKLASLLKFGHPYGSVEDGECELILERWNVQFGGMSGKALRKIL